MPRAREHGRSMEPMIILAVLVVVAMIAIPKLEKNPDRILPVAAGLGAIVAALVARAVGGAILARRRFRRRLGVLLSGRISESDLAGLATSIGNSESGVDAEMLAQPEVVAAVTDRGPIRERLFSSLVFALRGPARDRLRAATREKVGTFEEGIFVAAGGLFIEHMREHDGAPEVFASMLSRASPSIRQRLLGAIVMSGDPARLSDDWLAKWRPVVAPYAQEVAGLWSGYHDVITALTRM